jgi:hypothetical protein
MIRFQRRHAYMERNHPKNMRSVFEDVCIKLLTVAENAPALALRDGVWVSSYGGTKYLGEMPRDPRLGPSLKLPAEQKRRRHALAFKVESLHRQWRCLRSFMHLGGRKPILNYKDQPVFAELLILNLLKEKLWKRRVPMITISPHAPRMIPSEHLSRQRAGMNGIFDLSFPKIPSDRLELYYARLTPEARPVSLFLLTS